MKVVRWHAVWKTKSFHQLAAVKLKRVPTDLLEEAKVGKIFDTLAAKRVGLTINNIFYIYRNQSIQLSREINPFCKVTNTAKNKNTAIDMINR